MATTSEGAQPIEFPSAAVAGLVSSAARAFPGLAWEQGQRQEREQRRQEDRASGRCMCDWGDSAPPEVNTADIHRPGCPAA